MKNRYRPSLETLDDRICPVVGYFRNGTADGLWATAGNWRDAAVGGNLLGAAPSTNDEAWFDGNSPNCSVGNVTVKELHLTAAFANTLSIGNSNTLTVEGQSIGDDAELKAGTIAFGTSAKFMTGAVIVDVQGVDFNSTGTPKGSVHLYNGADWTLSGSPPRFNVGVWVGERTVGGVLSESAAYVHVNDLSGNINLVTPNNILVGQYATWDFSDPDPGLFASGGIEYTPITDSVFGNKGRVSFVKAESNGNGHAIMGVTIINLAGSTLDIGTTGSGVYYLDMFPTNFIGGAGNTVNIINGGTFNLKGRIYLNLDGGIVNQSAGVMTVDNDMQVGSSTIINSSRPAGLNAPLQVANYGTLNLQGRLIVSNYQDAAALFMQANSTLIVHVSCYTAATQACGSVLVKDIITIGNNVTLLTMDDYDGTNNPTVGSAACKFISCAAGGLTGTFTTYTPWNWVWTPNSVTAKGQDFIELLV